MRSLIILLFLACPAAAEVDGNYLLGVIFSSAVGKSVALIGNDDSGTRPYRESEMIGEYKIKSIGYSKVILGKGSKDFVLRKGDYFRDQLESLDISTDLHHDGDKVKMSQALRKYLVGDSLASVMMQASTWANLDEEGNIDGFYIGDIDPGSAYDLGGLKNNDLILEINGVPLDGPMTAVNALFQIRWSDRFDFVIKRWGQKRKIHVEIY